jgi:cell division protein FtsA
LAHLELEGVVAAPFASALAVLEEDEMDLGAVCIDMGGGSTSVAVFGGGSLLHVDSLNVGGAHVTSDIARGLSTTLAGAERLKTLHGSAIASAGEDRQMIETPPRGDDPGAGPVVAPRSMLKGIIAPRVEETLELVRDRLRAANAPIDAAAGIVLTGGASELAGVRETALRVFDRPVRLGRPRRAPHLAEAASGPAFCAAAGVLQRAAFGPREAAVIRSAVAYHQPPRHAQAGTYDGPLAKAVGWLRTDPRGRSRVRSSLCVARYEYGSVWVEVREAPAASHRLSANHPESAQVENPLTNQKISCGVALRRIDSD